MPRISPWRPIGLLTVAGLGLLWSLFFRPVAFGGDTAYIKVAGDSMEPSFYGGDLVVVRKQTDYGMGDVIAYRADGGIVIHRIIGGDAATGFDTQGDNRPRVDGWRPVRDQIVGSQVIRIPTLGVWMDLFQRPLILAAAAFAAVAFIIGGGQQKRRHRRS